MEPKLFKKSLNMSAEEFKEYLPVNVNLNFETISPFLILSENNYIKPLLGTDLFNRLANWYQDHPQESSESDEKDLLDFVRLAEIRLAIWKGFDSILTTINDTGISNEIEDNHRLFRYQEENLKNDLKNEGFDQLDYVLQFLEDKIDEFPEFKNSDHYTTSKNSLIHNTAEFNSCYNIENSRLVFLKMRYYIRDVEMITLKHRIGNEMYNELLTNDNLAEIEIVMQQIRIFIVYKAISIGIGELHKLPTEKGLIFQKSTSQDKEINPVSISEIKETQNQFSQKADRYLESAIRIMEVNPQDYAPYIKFAGASPADGVLQFMNIGKTFLA